MCPLRYFLTLWCLQEGPWSWDVKLGGKKLGTFLYHLVLEFCKYVQSFKSYDFLLLCKSEWITVLTCDFENS